MATIEASRSPFLAPPHPANGPPAQTLQAAVRRCNQLLLTELPEPRLLPPVLSGGATGSDADVPASPIVFGVRKCRALGGGDDTAGLDGMVNLLSQHVSFETLFEDGVEAARDIARLSGGCLRHAFQLVRVALNENDKSPIPTESIEVAASLVKADFERALPEAWIVHLKHVHEHNQFSESCPQEVKHAMLTHLFVLAYQNGDPWWDVHPLVLRCRKMGTARSHEQLS